MKILIKLLNRNSEFVAGCFYDYNSTEYSDYVIHRVLSDSMYEYDWDGDQTIENALNIFSSTMYNLYLEDGKEQDFFGTEDDETPGLCYKFNQQKDSIAENFLKRNLMKELDFGKSSCIILKRDWLPDAERLASNVIERAVIIDEGIY